MVGTLLALSALGSAAGIAGQARTNKKSMEFAEQQANTAWSRQLDMYSRMREDNSPLARRIQLNEAGLSPALLGGTAGSMGGSASGTSAPQGATPQLRNPMETANLGLMLAQIKNINADTKGKEIENTNKAEGGVFSNSISHYEAIAFLTILVTIGFSLASALSISDNEM